MEEEEKTNNYTCILIRSHDQKESREGASQKILSSERFPMMFNGYCYKCNNYGHKAIHCRDHEKIMPRRNQDEFFVQYYNFHHYGHSTKHCWIQGLVKVWRRKQVQSNDMNNMEGLMHKAVTWSLAPLCVESLKS